MKIAWLSSWLPRPCGIATYSEDLIQALKEAGTDVHIICHTNGGRPNEKNVYPIMDIKKHGWDEKVYDTVQRIKPDVIHIQHEYGLYQTSGDYASGLFRAMFRWKVEGKYPTVVTYHSVYTSLNKMRRLYMDVMQKLVDAGIVHAEYQWTHLPINLGHVVNNIYVIPHGAKTNISISKAVAKKELGLYGKPVVGMVGWFNPTKGFDRIIILWDELAKQLSPDTVLVLSGEARLGNPMQKEYKKKLFSLIEQCREKERIKVVTGSFSLEKYINIMAAFDVMVMPYIFASQSGNLANSFALGIPAVVSAIEGLKSEAEASGAAIAVPQEDDEELKRAIVTLMENGPLRKKLSQRAASYVKNKIAWPIIAEKHLKLYRKVIEEKKVQEKDVRLEVLLES